MGNERSHWFGLFAARQKTLSAEQILEVARQSEEARDDLGAALVQKGLITPQEAETLARMVEETMQATEQSTPEEQAQTFQTFADTVGAGFVETLARTLEIPISEAATLVQPGVPVADAVTVVQPGAAGADAATLVQPGAAGADAVTVVLPGASAPDAVTVVMPGVSGPEAATVGIAGSVSGPEDATVAGSMPQGGETVGRTGDLEQTISRDVWRSLRKDEAVPAVQEHAGRYEEIRKFGAGGMGQILLVHDAHLGRDVALKQLLTHMVGGATYTRTASGAPTASVLTVPMIARFLQEARVTGQLEHPSIVPVYELGYRSDGSLYYTMKLVRGRTLQEGIEQAGSLRERLNLLTHFLDLCHALAYAHSRGVVHRDLKPLNVMIGEFGETVLIDWGIAKIRGTQDVQAKELVESIQMLRVGETGATVKTMYGQAMGSPYYMPPEQAVGDIDKIDERSDVYALGAILYVLLTGQPPYFGLKAREFLEKVKSFPPKPPRAIAPDVPPELAAVCEKAMAHKPEDRYPTAKQLADEIQQYISGGRVGAYAYSLHDIIRHFVKKHRAVFTTSGIALVILIASAVGYGITLHYKNVELATTNTELVDTNVQLDASKKEAVTQRDEAVLQTKNARRSLYAATVSLAGRNLDENQVGAARERIAMCPVEYRGWEWGHLLYRGNADCMNIKGAARGLAFAAQGQQLISSSNNGKILLTDLKTGETVKTYAEEAGRNSALAASATGDRIAVCGDQSLTVWDTASGQVLLEFAQPQKVTSPRQVSISADGAYVAGTMADKKIRVWKIGGNDPIFEVPIPIEDKGLHIAFSPDSERLMVTYREFGGDLDARMLKLFSVPSGEASGQLTLDKENPASAACFNASGELVALGSLSSIQIIDTKTCKKTRTIELSEFQIELQDSLAFHPLGQWLAAASGTGDVGLWDLSTGELVKLVRKGHEDKVRSLAFSHNGQWLATTSYDRTVRLWSVPDLRLARVFQGHDSPVQSVIFNSEDTCLLTGSLGQSAKVWDLSAEVEFLELAQLDFHAAKGLLAGTLKSAPEQVLLWDAQNGHRIRPLAASAGKVEPLAFNAQGSLVGGCAEGKVLCWKVEDGSLLSEKEIAGEPTQLSFGGDNYLGVLTKEGFSVIDSATGTEVTRLAEATMAAFNADGTRLAASFSGPGENDRLTVTVRIVETATGKALGEFATPTSFSVKTRVIPEFLFTADGSRLFSSLTKEEKVTDILTWDLVKNAAGPVCKGHTEAITSLALSADGAWLASGSRDNEARIWDAVTGEPVGSPLKGHAAEVMQVTFSPDRHRLVTASQDRTFKIWDTQNGEELLTLQQSARTTAGVVMPERAIFNPDGSQLITLTDPITSPIVLHAFPFSEKDWGGTDEIKQDDVEAYKRKYWSQ